MQELNKINYPLFSVAMCVYSGDNPDWFDRALESIISQTIKPNEIVLVVDGPVPSIFENIFNKYIELSKKNNIDFKIVRLVVNSGHGIARRTSLENCSFEIVALMDSDDVCVNDRFKKQLEFFVNSDAGIVGGDISEFIDEETNIIGYRLLPTKDEEIKQYAKKRCPFNQMTVMMKKSIYNQVGGYLDWYCNEDYYLWVRMMLAGIKFANTGTVLVNVRVGNEMYQRRGGKLYFKSERKFQKYLLENKVISLPTYYINVLKRFIVQRLLPNKLRGWVFKQFARNKENG